MLLGAVSNPTGRAGAVVSAASGAVLGSMVASQTSDASALGEVVLAEDLSAWAFGGAGSAPRPPPPAPPSTAAAFLAWLPPYAAAPGASATAPDYTAAPATGGLLLPALANGTVFFAGDNSSELLACAFAGSASGAAQQLWSYISPHGALAALSVAWNGTVVYVGAADGAVVALSAVDGSVQWERSPCPRPCTFGSSALGALSPAGDLVFMPLAAVDSSKLQGAGFSGVLALDALSGNLTWSFTTAAAVTALALDAAGRLYVGDASGTVTSLAQDTGVVNALYKISGSSPVLVNGLALGGSAPGGMLYVATASSLLAVGGSSLPAAAP